MSFFSDVILQPAKAADKSVDLFRKVVALGKGQHPFQIYRLRKQGSMGIGEVSCFPLCHIQRKQRILGMFRQIGEAHSSTPVRLAILKTGASLVRPSLSRTSSLRSPKAMIRAP